MVVVLHVRKPNTVNSVPTGTSNKIIGGLQRLQAPDYYSIIHFNFPSTHAAT